ncbi:MAG: RluA family pseudouridine synthase [Spirochaetaceae bacterium]|nr:RluA family pseudouridine synthase [Spirochaetaceae bacterium]
MGYYHGTVELPFSEIKRLDIYIAENLRLMRRSQIKVRHLRAKVNGKPAKPSRIVKSGDDLLLSWSDCPPSGVIPENIPLNVLYEDERVIVLNKAQGMVVHPGAGNWSGTLAHALLWRLTEKVNSSAITGFTDSSRPFIVHRLDKDTSGVIIAAWDAATLAFLADQFKAGTVRKVYAAIVKGCPVEKRGIISSNIVRDKHRRKLFTVSENTGKTAITHYRVIRTVGDCSLLSLRPKTGRTHQLRVHLRSIGHPIIGDPLYGRPIGGGGDANTLQPSLALHAKMLEIVLPDGGKPSRFITKLPHRFKEILRQFND